MAKIGLATLMTDFGTHDPYVAAMKGVILRTCPIGRVVDICHDIPPHDVLAGAFVWAQAAPYFPDGTVHVGVVDPGVGTDRGILAAAIGGQIFLMPDNGLISFVTAVLPMEAVVVVRNKRYLPRAGVSATFHGRDVFAPLAGEIMKGLDIDELGSQPQTYKTLDIPQLTQDAETLVGKVLYVDRFGNLISNMSRQAIVERWPSIASLGVTCAGREIGPLRETYGVAKAGQFLALFNSMGLLEVAVNQDKACDVLQAGVGAEVRVSPRQLATDASDHGKGGE